MSLVDFGVFLATIPDAARLLVIPVFAWIAWRDIKTRRVPNHVWPPLLAVGLVLFLWDAWNAWGTFDWQFFAIPAAISIFVVIPAAYFMWFIGGFGGADAKAIMTLAVLFPTYPGYYIGTSVYPVVETPLGSFAFTIFLNAVLVALTIPIVLGVLNAVEGYRSKVMFLGRVQSVEDVPSIPGRLLETPDGFTRSGLDLDALRMYLRWRGVTLEDIQGDPGAFRHPVTIPETPNDPTDGAIKTDGGTVPPATERAEESTQETNNEEVLEEGDAEEQLTEISSDERELDSDGELDWWGAEAFLEDVGYAYGTTPSNLRDGLEVLVKNETVWVSPGTPFMVPIFVGLLIALVYGNLLFAVLASVGLL